MTAIARTGIVETQLVGGVEVDAVGLTGEADIPALLLDLLPALRVVQVVQVFSLLRQAPRKVGLKNDREMNKIRVSRDYPVETFHAGDVDVLHGEVGVESHREGKGRAARVLHGEIGL